MSQRQLDIADMQCWIFRMAQSKWNISASECTKLFKKMTFSALFQNAMSFSMSAAMKMHFQMLRISLKQMG